MLVLLHRLSCLRYPKVLCTCYAYNASVIIARYRHPLSKVPNAMIYAYSKTI